MNGEPGPDLEQRIVDPYSGQKAVVRPDLKAKLGVQLSQFEYLKQYWEELKSQRADNDVIYRLTL